MAISSGDTSWMLISTGLVMLMIPALGFFEARPNSKQEFPFSNCTNFFRSSNSLNPVVSHRIQHWSSLHRMEVLSEVLIGYFLNNVSF